MMQQLSLQQRQEIKKDLAKEGTFVDDKDIDNALLQIEKSNLSSSFDKTQQHSRSDPRQFSQHSVFSTKANEDIVRWQLELNDILERAEHILRGDIVVFKEGHLIWEKNPNPKENCLNEYGVQSILKVLSMYINRNTILSDYEKEEINYKVLDFGKEINNLVFKKYEEFGMDTEDKRKEYPMLVRELVDIVHSSYKRALMGGERRSLREMISIQQSHQLAQPPYPMPMASNQQQTRSIFNPMRYLRGKYVS